MNHAVELEGVSKSFGEYVAVNNLSLHVPQNTIYGFIGPNGSGKTTTIRMIMRIFYPDGGVIRVLGNESHQAINDRIGYLPEERGLYKKMKVREMLEFYAALKGVRDSQSAIQHWLERMGLPEWGESKIEALSKGMAQKIQFIGTIISKPELVILDEPFSGLDPVNTEVMREAVLSLKKDGATIIFSTHDMSVAEKMCDFIFMIYKGKKVLDGTLETIQDTYGTDTIRVRMDQSNLPYDRLPGILKITDFGRYHEMRLEKNANSQLILAELMKLGAVRHFEQVRPSLEDIFVRIASPELETKVA